MVRKKNSEVINGVMQEDSAVIPKMLLVPSSSPGGMMTTANSLNNLISTSSSSLIKIEESSDGGDEDSEIDVEEDRDLHGSGIRGPVDLTRSSLVPGSTTVLLGGGVGVGVVKNESDPDLKLKRESDGQGDLMEDEDSRHLKPDTTTNIQGKQLQTPGRGCQKRAGTCIWQDCFDPERDSSQWVEELYQA